MAAPCGMMSFGTARRARLHRASALAGRCDGSEECVLTEHTLDNAALMERTAHGDEDALGALYDRFGRSVYSLCLRIVRDTATAEELTQEVFVRLWRSAASF